MHLPNVPSSSVQSWKKGYESVKNLVSREKSGQVELNPTPHEKVTLSGSDGTVTETVTKRKPNGDSLISTRTVEAMKDDTYRVSLTVSSVLAGSATTALVGQLDFKVSEASSEEVFSAYNTYAAAGRALDDQYGGATLTKATLPDGSVALGNSYSPSKIEMIQPNNNGTYTIFDFAQSDSIHVTQGKYHHSGQQLSKEEIVVRENGDSTKVTYYQSQYGESSPGLLPFDKDENAALAIPSILPRTL